MFNRHSSTYRSRRARFEKLEKRCMMAYLPGDYDLSTVVDEDDFLLWRANFGEVGESPIDGNGNGVVDAADYTIWRDNLGNTLADVAPDAPRGIEARAVGSTSIEISWEAAAYATGYVIFRAEIGSGSGFAVTGSTNPDLFYTDNTATPDTLYEYRVVAQNSHGDSPLSQGAEATANQSNLTAYRPQSVQDPNNPVDAPIYAPFPKKPVWDQDESSSAFGPGIRVNLDDDNNNGIADRLEHGYEIPLENDLIEVRVDRLPGQGDMELADGGNLSLFYDHDKETPIPFDPDTFNTEPLPFVNDTITVFVEWIGSGHGTDTLSLVDLATSTTQDIIRFHTFRSLVVVFGGRSQDPHDTDGDGSIGDPVGSSATNREGIFDLAQTLYDTGWDVMAFDSTDTNIDNVVSVAETEIKSAYDYRLLDPAFGGAGFAILGYSWGGGATHDLIERLYSDSYFPFFSVYLDAVDHGTAAQENDWPMETFYLLNIWQPNGFLELGGGPISNPQEMSPFSELEEQQFPALDHYSIDDDPLVLQLIRTRLGQLLVR